MDADRVVELLRRQRHDFGNHLQVISGYLQLGMNDQLGQYINTIVEEMAEEKVIFELSPQTTLYLYKQLLLARDQGIILRFDDLDIKSLDILESRNEPFVSVVSLGRDMPAAENYPVLYLSLNEDDTGIDMVFSCSCFGDEPRRFRINKE